VLAKAYEDPLIFLSMLTLLLGPIDQARAFFCPICDGSKTSAMEIIGSGKSKLRDKVGSDLDESDAGWIRKILEEPRVIDNLGFARGSTTSSGPAPGNYRFILDGMIRNGDSDFTWPRNCGGNGGNPVPDSGSTVMLTGLALIALGGIRHKRKL
jgi:VPDSG-CTERM motif